MAKYTQDMIGFIILYRACLIMFLPVTLFMIVMLFLMQGGTVRFGTVWNDFWSPEL